MAVGFPILPIDLFGEIAYKKIVFELLIDLISQIVQKFNLIL